MTQTPTQPRYDLTDADKVRQKQIAAAWKAYHGQLDPPLKPMPGDPDDNVLSNRMQAIVDRGIDFLFGQELELALEEDAPKAAQEFLNDVWGRKEQRIPLLQKLAMNGAMAGRAFLRIVPDTAGNFRLVAVDPATVFVQTAPQDCDTVLLYCIEYSVSEKINGKPTSVYYHEEITRIDPDGNARHGMPDSDDTWEVRHWTRIGDQGNWQPVGDPIAWNYEFSPLFSCQNLPLPNEFWGMPDLTPDLIGINVALNLVQSNINRINKLFGSPILYAVGTGMQVIDLAPGRIIGLPTDQSKIAAVTITSDLANALAFANNLRSDLDEQSGVPGVATGRIVDLPRGNMSGIVLELLFMPLLKKTDKKRCLYGDLIIAVSKALLILNKMSGGINMTLPWQNPMPDDDLQSVQAAVLKKQVGISDSTIQRELGYDPEEEAQLNAVEDAQQLTNFSRGVGMPPTSTQPGQPGIPPTPSVPPAQAGQPTPALQPTNAS